MKEIIVAYDETQKERSPVMGKWVGELVRCSDCKHGEPGDCGDGIDCEGVWHDANWYCADGERKET